MLIFVTGATGFVGSAVVQELISARYKVVGLARSDAGAKSVAAAGVQVHRGDLTDLESLRKAVAAADAVIHTGFDNDFSKFAENCEIDKRAIEVLGSALESSDRPLLVTNGLALLVPGRKATEEDMAPVPSTSYPRASEAMADKLVARGVRASVVRLAPSVHGDGDHGFVPFLINLAREKGASAHVGDGNNRWPTVHRLDAAHLYRLALENGTAGARYHGVAEEGLLFRDIAEVIGRGLNVPVVSKAAEDAANHFGWFRAFAATDMSASSQRTRELLRWQPRKPGLIAELEDGTYFKSDMDGNEGRRAANKGRRNISRRSFRIQSQF